VTPAEAQRNPPCVEFAWREGCLCCTQGTATARAPPVGAFLAIVPLTCSSSAPRGIRTFNRQIRSLVLCVDLVGSRRIWPAHVGWVVGPDGSRPVPSDRLDDQRMIKCLRWKGRRTDCSGARPASLGSGPHGEKGTGGPPCSYGVLTSVSFGRFERRRWTSRRPGWWRSPVRTTQARAHCSPRKISGRA
jgi:hypothetical protein